MRYRQVQQFTSTQLREIVSVVADQVREDSLIDSFQVFFVAITNLDVTILAKVGGHRFLPTCDTTFFLLVAESRCVEHVICARNESHDRDQVRLEDQSFDPKNSLCLFAHNSAPPMFYC